MPAVQYESIRLAGGLDEITPSLSLKPGVVRNAVNFECSATGGYARIGGYERYDGHAKPSEAVYTILPVTGSTTPALLSTITGDSSGATGVLVAQSAASFVLTKVTGTFTSGEVLKVGITTVATYGGSGEDVTQLMMANYRYAAAEAYRSDIAAPTGAGPIRGVFELNDTIYAFRNNAGNTACNLWKATASGWTQVNYGYTLSYSTGTSEILDGDTVVGDTSGATGVCKRVMAQSGSWAGTSAGVLVFLSITGTFQNGELLKVGGTNRATCVGTQAAIAMSPSGKFEVVIGNFFGGASTRAYGCDGVNKGWEFDGTTLCPLTTGSTPDTPSHVNILKNHLFFAIATSLVHSGVGTPYTYTTLSGASEIAIGANITGTLVQPGQQSTGAMSIYTGTDTFILYGTSSADWNLVPYNIGSGATAFSGQNLNQSYTFNQLGVIGLATAINYGNFAQSTLTQHIAPYLSTRKDSVACSTVSRAKSQYRLFFTDGSGLYLTVSNGEFVGVMPIYLPISGDSSSGAFCAWESQQSDGTEVILIGGADGMVYEMDKGMSFDGAEINAKLILTYDAIRSPRVLKRFRKAMIEMFGSGYAAFYVGYLLGYSSSDIEQPAFATLEQGGSSAYWDSFTWDSFTWDGTSHQPIEVELVGTAENVALIVQHDSAINAEFTLNTIMIHYTPRRGMR